jgi:hypothetical protein
MYRRRHRPRRDIVFGLDSFLDVVANVIGVVIRLILVAWVGARSYQSLTALSQTDPPPPGLPAESDDPLKGEVASSEHELQRLQARLLEQLRQVQQARSASEKVAQRLALVARRRQELGALPHAGSEEQEQTAAGRQRSLEELKQRRAALEKEMAALEKAAPARRLLRYHTPVSRPVHSDELHFECRAGRVAFIDVAAFQAEIRQQMREKSQLLRRQWQVEDVTAPMGAFRLRYVIERERGLMDSLAAGGTPDPDANFRYGVAGWFVEPIAPQRGETAEAALARGSEFRQIADTLDPDLAVVTFWVYEDSFALYRRLRDHLAERGIEVAGRPLPLGHPIASTRHGTASRGQ